MLSRRASLSSELTVAKSLVFKAASCWSETRTFGRAELCICWRWQWHQARAVWTTPNPKQSVWANNAAGGTRPKGVRLGKRENNGSAERSWRENPVACVEVGLVDMMVYIFWMIWNVGLLKRSFIVCIEIHALWLYSMSPTCYAARRETIKQPWNSVVNLMTILTKSGNFRKTLRNYFFFLSF